jgi:hypothetical protein
MDRSLQTGIELLQHWFSENSLEFNAWKTKIIPSVSKAYNDRPITLSDIPILLTGTVKDLYCCVR